MKTLSKLAAALVLGAALTGTLSVTHPGTAAAAEDKGKQPQVSKAAAKDLKAAQELINKKEYKDGIEKLKAVEALPNRTPYDTHVMNELYGYAYARLGDYAQATKYLEPGLSSGFLAPGEAEKRVKELATVNYQLKNYDKAAELGEKAIKGGYADDNMYTLVSQSYYLKGDYKSALKFTENWTEGEIKKGEAPKQQPLALILNSCIKLNDDACTQRAIERLVQYYPKPEYWQNLLFSMLNQKGVSDRTMLDIYRLAYQVDALKNPEQYTEMAELAMDQGEPAEAQRVLEKGTANGVFTDQRTRERAERLLATAKKRAAADQVGLSKLAQDASNAKTGDPDVALGQAYMSYEQYDKAVAAINDGLTKGGLKNEAQARLQLGIAQLKSGNKADATKTFHTVKGDPTLERLASLWTLYAHQAQASVAER